MSLNLQVGQGFSLHGAASFGWHGGEQKDGQLRLITSEPRPALCGCLCAKHICPPTLKSTEVETIKL